MHTNEREREKEREREREREALKALALGIVKFPICYFKPQNQSITQNVI